MYGGVEVDKLIIWKMINYVWIGVNYLFVEEICQIGDGFVFVMCGVWVYIMQNKEGSIILLDVEVDDFVDEIFKVYFCMFIGIILFGLNIMVCEFI